MFNVIVFVLFSFRGGRAPAALAEMQPKLGWRGNPNGAKRVPKASKVPLGYENAADLHWK